MQRADGTVVIIDPVAGYDALDYEGDIVSARLGGEPMVKGPHYKTEPAQAAYDDDPDNPHAPPDPGTTAWNQQQQEKSRKEQPALWQNADGPTKKAFDEWKTLFYKTYRTPEENARLDQLNAYLEQKRKVKQQSTITKPNGINSPSEAQAEFDQILAKKSNMTTADFKRADELNDYLNKVEDKRWKTTPKVTFGKTNSNQWNENKPAKR